MPGAYSRSETFTRLADVPAAIDMVDVFRRSSAAGGVVDEALQLDPLPRVIWMQLGVVDEEAAKRARSRGVTVVMDRCPKIEFGRLTAGPLSALKGAQQNQSPPQQNQNPSEQKPNRHRYPDNREQRNNGANNGDTLLIPHWSWSRIRQRSTRC